MPKSEKQIKVEAALSKVAGIPVELTTRSADKLEFTVSFEGDNPDAQKKIKDYLANGAIWGDCGFDDQCDMTYMYFTAKPIAEAYPAMDTPTKAELLKQMRTLIGDSSIEYSAIKAWRGMNDKNYDKVQALIKKYDALNESAGIDKTEKVLKAWKNIGVKIDSSNLNEYVQKFANSFNLTDDEVKGILARAESAENMGESAVNEYANSGITPLADIWSKEPRQKISKEDFAKKYNAEGSGIYGFGDVNDIMLTYFDTKDIEPQPVYTKIYNAIWDKFNGHHNSNYNSNDGGKEPSIEDIEDFINTSPDIKDALSAKPANEDAKPFFKAVITFNSDKPVAEGNIGFDKFDLYDVKADGTSYKATITSDWSGFDVPDDELTDAITNQLHDNLEGYPWVSNLTISNKTINESSVENFDAERFGTGADVSGEDWSINNTAEPLKKILCAENYKDFTFLKDKAVDNYGTLVGESSADKIYTVTCTFEKEEQLSKYMEEIGKYDGGVLNESKELTQAEYLRIRNLPEARGYKFDAEKKKYIKETRVEKQKVKIGEVILKEGNRYALTDKNAGIKDHLVFFEGKEDDYHVFTVPTPDEVLKFKYLAEDLAGNIFPVIIKESDDDVRTIEYDLDMDDRNSDEIEDKKKASEETMAAYLKDIDTTHTITAECIGESDNIDGYSFKLTGTTKALRDFVCNMDGVKHEDFYAMYAIPQNTQEMVIVREDAQDTKTYVCSIDYQEMKPGKENETEYTEQNADTFCKKGDVVTYDEDEELVTVITGFNPGMEIDMDKRKFSRYFKPVEAANEAAELWSVDEFKKAILSNAQFEEQCLSFSEDKDGFLEWLSNHAENLPYNVAKILPVVQSNETWCLDSEEDVDAMIDAIDATVNEGYSAIGAGPEATAAGGLVEDAEKVADDFSIWATSHIDDRTESDGQIHYITPADNFELAKADLEALFDTYPALKGQYAGEKDPNGGSHGWFSFKPTFKEFIAEQRDKINEAEDDDAAPKSDAIAKKVADAKEQGLKLFFVSAHSGRYNGAAIMCCKSSADARKLAHSGGWLDLGTVDSVMTVKKSTTEDDLIDYFGSEDDILNATIKEGWWEELEWGT